jgi:hypothetical protein
MTGRTAWRRLGAAALGLVLAAAGFLGAPGLHAQTATTGILTGEVRGPVGEPLEGVEITLLRAGGVDERVILVGRDGHFHSGFLPPGRYEALVERFGYIPVRIGDITIRSGRQASFQVELREAPPPVTEVDRFSFGQVGQERSAGGGQAVTGEDMAELPIEGRELAGLMSLWSQAGTGFAAGGLPGRYTALEVDGVGFAPASDRRSGPGFLDVLALPTAFLADAELQSASVDSELGDGPGATIRATTTRGGDQLRTEAFGQLLGAPLGATGPFDAEVPSSYVPDAGIVVRGPIRPDTAHFALGVLGRQEVRPLAAIGASAPELGQEYLQTTGDDSRPDGDRVATPRTGRWNTLATFGRLDWRFGGSSTISLRSHVGTFRLDEQAWMPASGLLSGEARRGTDVLLSGEFFTALSDRGAMEVRLGMGSSTRDGHPSDAMGAAEFQWVQQGGVVMGGMPREAVDRQRRTVELTPILHTALGSHQLKVGFTVLSGRFEEEGLSGWNTASVFPDLDAARDGQRKALTWMGPNRDVSFDVRRMVAFAEDRWSLAPGLTLTGAIRLERETLPVDEVTPNEEWQARTGLPRISIPEAEGRYAPRVGLEWTPADGSGWRLAASSGVQLGQMDPHLMAELLSEDGSVRVRHQLAPLGEGPLAGPWSEGARLTLLGPNFQSPRSLASRASVGRDLMPGTALEVEVEHRRTDFLPRRRDLNQAWDAAAVDQFGRELFGEIVQHEGLIAVRPGSDRLFQEFDVVSALESDGWSERWGVTVGVRHDAGGPLRLNARYTFSETTDNLPGFAYGWPTALPGRVNASGREADWVEGRSDLDVPHRLVVDGSLSLLERPGLRVGALYAFHSGTPFTPGVRDLLTGTSSLEWHTGAPITVPSDLMGELGGLTGRWDCLRPLGSSPAERNTCRTDPVHELNLRLAVTVRDGPGWRVELAADGLNLLDSGPVLPDAALFVVDGRGSLGSAPGGELRLPVKVNPGFGEPVVNLSPGRMLRIGLGVRY